MTKMKSQTLTIGELLGMMMFKVYYTDPITDGSHAHNVETLIEALQYTEGFRKLGMTFVTMVVSDPNQVGKTGVD